MRAEAKTDTPQKHAVVIGDGPAGLATAIMLIKRGYKVTLVGERQGEYTRTQVLRFGAVDFRNYAALLFGVELGAAVEPAEVARLTSQHIAALKAKSFVRASDPMPEAASERHYANHNTRPLDGFFIGDGDFITMQIKHIEQSLFAQLKKLSAAHGDSCDFVYKKRQEVTNPDGSVRKDLGAVQSISADGEIVLKDEHGVEQAIRPDFIIPADGRQSIKTGVLAEINRHIADPEDRFNLVDSNYTRTLNPQHSVGIYNTSAAVKSDVKALLSHPFSDQAVDLRGELDIPTEAELRAMGWMHYAAPERRLLRGKDDTVYMATETPETLLAIVDPFERNAKLQQWHRLVMRYELPERMITPELLYVKGADYLKPDEDKLDEIEQTLIKQKRAKRYSLSVGGFEVEVDKEQHLDKSFSVLGSTAVLPVGDALERVTHYQTATGLDSAFKTILALQEVLFTGERSTPGRLMRYSTAIDHLHFQKDSSNRRLQRLRSNAASDARLQVARELIVSIADIGSGVEAASEASRIEELRRIINIIHADPSICLTNITPGRRRTAFDEAVDRGWNSVVNIALDHGQLIELLRESPRATNLRFLDAIKHNRLSIDTIKRLNMTGDAIHTTRLCDGMTPLMYAAVNGNEEVAEYLLSQGANIDAVDRLDNTAFSYAIRENKVSLKLIEKLLPTPENINRPDSRGITPFMHAAANGNEAVMLYLLHANVEPFYESLSGGSAESFAESAGHQAAFESACKKYLQYKFKQIAKKYKAATSSSSSLFGMSMPDKPLLFTAALVLENSSNDEELSFSQLTEVLELCLHSLDASFDTVELFKLSFKLPFIGALSQSFSDLVSRYADKPAEEMDAGMAAGTEMKR
ncbi:MAG: ankyrin repeat domain-containing protein [Coxiellaceae bacterium]|nr:ankyrin repeat domain-containing protein [Coxiellaceae bacterium]